MKWPAQRWLRAVLTATVLVFVAQAALLYGTKFFAWIESDASVTVLLAARTLRDRVPIVPDWYYANGDVWVLAPHLFALLPVALLGVAPSTLLVSVVSGFVIELALLTRVYRRLARQAADAGPLWVAGLASLVTLSAWSQAHVAFVYIQLAYGLTTVLSAIAFGLFAERVAGDAAGDDARSTLRRWAGPSLFLFLVNVQNPTRALAFVVAPLIAACAWPFRGLPLRRRIEAVAALVLSLGLASAAYKGPVSRFVTFAFPKGHNEFVVEDLVRMKENARFLVKGIAVLGGGSEEPTLRSVPGLLLLLLTTVLVAREVFAGRAVSPLRFFAVVVAAQLAMLLMPLAVGNLMLSSSSARYLMPAFMLAYGVAAILAVRALDGTRWTRAGGVAWLSLVPVAALLAIPSSAPPPPQLAGWPNGPELARLASELDARGLSHGFSSVLNANIMNLQARGKQGTCPVFFAHVLIPHRWLADTGCFTFDAIPERFYVLADRGEHDEKSIQATLPPPIERFQVGDTYVVSVFRKAGMPVAWLDLPIRDGELAAFPMRLEATHLGLLRRNAVVEGNRLVATGEPGYVLHGPYLRMPKGSYDVRWRAAGIDSPGEITFVISTDFGKNLPARTTVAAATLPREPGEVAHLSFVLEKNAVAFEVHVISAGGARIALEEVVVTRR